MSCIFGCDDCGGVGCIGCGGGWFGVGTGIGVGVGLGAAFAFGKGAFPPGGAPGIGGADGRGIAGVGIGGADGLGIASLTDSLMADSGGAEGCCELRPGSGFKFPKFGAVGSFVT